MKNLFRNTFSLTAEMIRQDFPVTKCKECGKGFYFFDIDSNGYTVIAMGVQLNTCYDHGVNDAVQEYMQELDRTNNAILN